MNLNPKGGAQVIKGPIEAVLGVREIFVEVAGLELRVSPGSFFQVNLGVLPEIHSRMAGFLGGGLLIDLYRRRHPRHRAARKLRPRALGSQWGRTTIDIRRYEV